MIKEENKMITVTLVIDPKRHQKLKQASKMTRFSMSELARVALDRFWNDLGDLSNLGPKAIGILYNTPEQEPVEASSSGKATKGRKKSN